MTLNKVSHIEIDVAIEIINEMIGDCYAYICDFGSALETKQVLINGFEEFDKHVLLYNQKQKNLVQFRSEIRQIYGSQNLTGIRQKVEKEYAPFLRRKHLNRAKVAL